MFRTAFLISLSAVLFACGESTSEPAGDAGATGAITEMADNATEMVETARTAAASIDTSWFYQGGSLNRASTVEDWLNADMGERLASAADLLKMNLDELPAPSQAMDMARTLETEITKAAESAGSGSLGSIVDQALASLGW